MPKRHALPTLWLITDERLGPALWPALAALPRGSGVVFRHLSLDGAARRALFMAVRVVARRRRLVLLVAGPHPLRGADGRHAAATRRLPGVRSAPVHDAAELIAAQRAGADLVFLSPVYPTRSHPGAPALGRVRFGMLARAARVPVIALGGMTAGRFAGVKPLGAYGWAAIDGLTPPDQKRKAVPR
ncbi:thiamine phosphate synthase [Sphingomonas quercus]|uniref:Thiamine phosphate synthase n=1 Tax=Sphingomonas quercus TaxID=2842451 RepID=A0ABS6BF65_9SPHN|nr:thiamine phosphate synthase [Sphingomonas quercus]MBU3076943.1 thiamine phosphate synthase [Sphingomonas quercus]